MITTNIEHRKYKKRQSINGCLFLYINLSEVTIMTAVKCNKHKCYYNIEEICSHHKINLRYFKYLNYTRDDKRTFKVQDLID